MTERDRAAGDVDFGRVEFQASNAGEHLRRERFVDFEQVDVADC